MDSCPFCLRIRQRELALEAPLAVALPDGFPLNPGHTLVVPRRHVASYFDLTQDEQAELWSLVARTKAQLDERHHAAGYNVGINIGEVAGQTVGHAHVHLIPRHAGDVADPRGGIRWVIPERAAYWRTGE